MNKELQLIILSMPKSPRLSSLKKRLKELKIKDYKIFYGNNGDTKQKKKLFIHTIIKKRLRNLLGAQ